jgi:hypothetical protein
VACVDKLPGPTAKSYAHWKVLRGLWNCNSTGLRLFLKCGKYRRLNVVGENGHGEYDWSKA